MMKKRYTILAVEDEEAILIGLEENLKFEGYDVLTTRDGQIGLKMALEKNPDLVLLDVMLPGMSGYDVCRKLRDKGKTMPIIMLTARQEEFDKLHGFEMGADDYVTKPFSVKELMARIRAVLMRTVRRETSEQRVYEFGDCRMDLDTRIFTREGKPVPMTRTEFDLLAYFCQNEGKALSREMVMNDVWGTQYFGTQRSLDSFVASLRSKVEAVPHSPKFILTVHGVGYKFSGMTTGGASVAQRPPDGGAKKPAKGS